MTPFGVNESRPLSEARSVTFFNCLLTTAGCLLCGEALLPPHNLTRF